MQRRTDGGGAAQRKGKIQTYQAPGAPARHADPTRAPDLAFAHQTVRLGGIESNDIGRGRGIRVYTGVRVHQNAEEDVGRGWGWLQRVGAAPQCEAKQEGNKAGWFKWAGERERPCELARSAVRGTEIYELNFFPCTPRRCMFTLGLFGTSFSEVHVTGSISSYSRYRLTGRYFRRVRCASLSFVIAV